MRTLWTVACALLTMLKIVSSTDLCIGQDFDSIETYTSQYGRPIVYMSYTNLTTLSGVFSPIDYGSGIQYAQGLLDLQPGAALNLGLWLGGLDGLKSIVAGDLDSNILRISEFATSNLDSKIYLRIGYEFDK